MPTTLDLPSDVMLPPSWWQRRLDQLMARVRTSWRPRQVFLRPDLVQDAGRSVVQGHAIALACWASWCAENPGSQCELALSGHWLLNDVGTPEQARQRWGHYLGLGADTLDKDWLVRSVDAKGLGLLCAAPVALIESLRAVARDHGVVLRWVGPWWAREVQRCWSEPDHLESNELTAIEPGLRIHFQAAPGELGEKAQRACHRIWSEPVDLGETLAEAEPKQPVALTIEAPWATDALLAALPAAAAAQRRTSWFEALDFVGPRVRTALWAWGLLVLSLSASVFVADQAQQVNQAMSAEQNALRRLERAQHQQKLASTAPRADPQANLPTVPVLDDLALRQALRMVRLLAYPWPAVITRIETAADQEKAVLMAFSFDAATGTDARLQVAARDDASALRWIALQGEDAQLLNRNLLTTPFDTVNGHYALKVEALWSPGVSP